MQGYRQQNFSIIAFEKEIATAIMEAHPSLPKETPIVERLFRLERGGFRMQLSEHSWETMAYTPGMKITTQKFGTWHKRLPIGGPTGPSFVINSVDKEITTDEIKEQIVLNSEIHELQIAEAQPAIAGVTRLKRRNPDTEELEESFTVPVRATETMTAAFLAQGIIKIGHRLCRTRAYEPTRRRCMKCGRLGNHVEAECRFHPVCRHCGKSHLSTQCPQRPDPFTDAQRQAEQDRSVPYVDLDADREASRKKPSTSAAQ